MKTAEEWDEIRYHDKVERYGGTIPWIRAIQSDAKHDGRLEGLREAAEIADKMCHSPECKDKWSITRTGSFISFRDAILARVKELEVGK